MYYEISNPAILAESGKLRNKQLFDRRRKAFTREHNSDTFTFCPAKEVQFPGLENLKREKTDNKQSHLFGFQMRCFLLHK